MEILVDDLQHEVHFNCLDEDVLKNDLVGEGKIKLSEVEELPESDMSMWVPIYYGKGKSAGRILFEFEYLPLQHCKHAPAGEEFCSGTHKWSFNLSYYCLLVY